MDVVVWSGMRYQSRVVLVAVYVGIEAVPKGHV